MRPRAVTLGGRLTEDGHQQKISGRLTSSDVTQARLDIRSYIDTARKHGQDVLTALRAAMTGTPWNPPVPATAPGCVHDFGA